MGVNGRDERLVGGHSAADKDSGVRLEQEAGRAGGRG
jgi:hypothetical protein